MSVALDFHNGNPIRKGNPIHTGRIGVMPGAFNPPTIAHLQLAREARDQYQLDQVVFLLPRAFPHKHYGDTDFDQRLDMLRAATADDPTFAIASSGGGLFIEIARDCLETSGPGVEVFILCGRDAAERAVSWDYGDGPTFHRQLDEFQMLVASRAGSYQTPREYEGRIHTIQMPPSSGAVSSSAVRQAIQTGAPWQTLVPPAILDHILAEGLYRGPVTEPSP